MWLTHLPQSVREAVHFTSLTKLSNGILNFILSNNVRQINVFCLIALDADCKRLISFSDSCGKKESTDCW